VSVPLRALAGLFLRAGNLTFGGGDAITAVLQRKGRVLDAVSGSMATLRQHLKPEDQKLLDDLNLTRTEFEYLARSMDLPVSKQDNADRLREKIIGASIGSRLISHAIRGT